jgi:hypothetical protein
VNEQRKEILQLLAEGKVTPDEAEQLIAALERDQPDTTSASTEVRSKPRPKYLRVVVDMAENFDGNGPGRVNIRVPLQLLRAGVRLASLIPPQALGKADDELKKSGMPFDLSQLKPEQLEALIEHLDEVTVEVDQPDTKVHVFCE